jgi:hypothetical protein
MSRRRQGDIPFAGPVKITRADGSVEIQPAIPVGRQHRERAVNNFDRHWRDTGRRSPNGYVIYERIR